MSTPHCSRPDSRLLRWTLLAAVALLLPSLASAQDAPPDTAAKPLSQTFALEYDLVYRAVKTALERSGYTVGYASKKNQRVETEFRQLAEEENFFDNMEKYGEIPYMRSPGWTVGRCQIVVTFASSDAGHTTANVTAQLSGYEARFENRWIYWSSNGVLEKQAMDSIVVAVNEETKRSRSGQ